MARITPPSASLATGVVSVNTQTADYTPVIADAGAVIRMNVAAANNLTVPPNSSVAFPIGTIIEVAQAGAGRTTLVAGAGVTLNALTGQLSLPGQFGRATLVKTLTDTWAVWVQAPLAASTLGTNQDSATAFDVLPRELITTSVAHTSGYVVLTPFTPSSSFTADRMFYVTGTAFSGLTLCRFGLYRIEANGDATLLAQTANDTTLLTSASAVSPAAGKVFDTGGGYPATYALVGGQRYAAAVIAVGSGMGNLRGANPPSFLVDLAPKIGLLRTGQADLPSSILSANFAAGGFGMPWARLGKV